MGCLTPRERASLRHWHIFCCHLSANCKCPPAPAVCGEQQEQGSGKGCPWGAQDPLSSGGEEGDCCCSCCCSWAVMCQWQRPSVCLPRVLLPLNSVSPEFSLFSAGPFQTLFKPSLVLVFFPLCLNGAYYWQKYLWYLSFICTLDQSRH